MNKYVLLIVTGVLLVLPAFADYLNDTRLRERSERWLEGEDASVPHGDNLLFMMKRYMADSVKVDTDHITVGIRPPVKVPPPLYTRSDSVDSGNLRVLRQNQIKGFEVRDYRFIPIEDYTRENLEKSLLSTWRNNTGRMNNWTADKKSGGVSDLDFAIPVGKRFEKFVGGKTRLDINGSQTITFSGKSEYDEGQIETSLTKNSAFPSLSMKQEPQFSIRGQVGERITVDIKQESGAEGFSLGGSLEDNISIKYKGDTNDIIQNIEAGNTSLNLEGATFAGYSGSHKGLFGIRSEGRLGPIKFTAIASQEKSEANTKTFRGSAEETSNQIRDYNYKGNTYFFLDFRYRNRFAEDRTSLDQIYYNPPDSLVKIEVYEDDGIQTNNTKEGTLALPGFVIPENMDESIPEKNPGIQGFFHRLEPQKDYYVDRSLGYIVFRNRVQDNSTIGVYLKTKDGREYGSLVYNPDDPNSRIRLKLIKLRNQRPTDTDTWDLEWKNVYDLGQQNIEPEGLEVRIFRDTSDGPKKDTQNGIPIIHILGLDNQDETGNQKPDNKIDLNRTFVNLYRGELIFPILRPFDSVQPKGVTVMLDPKVPQIYDTQNQQEKVEASKYYIEVKTASRQKTIRIQSLSGITEGTEKVTLNGKTLSRGTDYNIIYQTGEVILLNKDALSPTANLQISYEEENAFQPMQKSLLGLRSEYEFWGNSRVGGVFLFNNESTTDKRVKLGQEPSRTMLFDTDALINYESQFLTNMVDKLPMVIADRKSTIRFEGELARSMPNMNTKGVVYVDDFEGTQNTPLGIGRTNWNLSSAPDPTSTGGLKLTRGRLQWYNPWDRVDSRSIWPNKETSAGENTVHVLNLAYGAPKDVAPDEAFAGVTSAFYGNGVDLSRARYLEVWLRGSKGKLKIDIGSVSEDYFPLDNPNGLLDTEDKPIPGQGHGDGVLVPDEDTGLDGVFDRDEPGYGPGNSDPNRDNWSYKDRNDFSRINGTEGNSYDSDRAGLPDTEDINNNGVLDTKTAYYEYTLSLDDSFDPYLVPDSVPTGNPGGWRLFRIPLWNNSRAVVGGATPPDSTLIEYTRLWITGCDTTLVQIASIEITESNWLEQGVFNSDNKAVSVASLDKVKVTRVNTDENREYVPPPGVSGEIDRTTKVRKMEQSLVLEYENLMPGNTAFIYRNFGEKMDFTDYTSLKMFAHGPDDFPDASTGDPKAELIVRFGADKDNYYEYRTPLYKGWAEQNLVDAIFATCTAVKLKRKLSDDPKAAFYDTVGTKIYSLKGDPNLQNVKIVAIGIRNTQTAMALNGRVWLDELRMDNVRDMTGTAARANVTADLSGFVNLTGRITRRSADFHDMNSKKGSGTDNTDWGSSIALNLDRFTPKRWNLSVPVTANITETDALPRLMSGSDIILNDDQKREYSSTSSDRNFSVTYRKNTDPSKKGVAKYVINWGLEKWSASYTWGSRKSDNPASGSANEENTQAKLTYNVDPKGKTVKPFAWAKDRGFGIGNKIAEIPLAYTPTQLSYDVSYDARNRFNTNIDGVSDTTKTEVANESMNFGYDPLGNFLRYRFRQTKSRDLILKEETSYTEGNDVNITGPQLRYFPNSYTYAATYTEKNNRRYSLSSQIGGRQVGQDKKFSINASVEWARIIEDLSGKPKPAGESKLPGSDRERRDAKKKEDQRNKAIADSIKTAKADSLKGGEKTKKPDPKAEAKAKAEAEKKALADSIKTMKAKVEEKKKALADSIRTAKAEAKKKAEAEKKKAEDLKKAVADSIKTAKAEAKAKADEEKRNAEDEKRRKAGKFVLKKERDGGKTSAGKPLESAQREGQPPTGQESKLGLRTRMFMAVSRSLSPITFRYSKDSQLSYAGVSERPGFMVRFGRGAISPPDSDTVVSRQNTFAETETMSFDTSMKLPLDMGFSATADLNNRDTQSLSANSRSKEATLPEIDFKWGNIEKRIPYLKRVMNNVQITSRFSIKAAREWLNDDPNPTNDRTTTSHSPLVSLNGILFGGLQTSVSYNMTSEENLSYSGETSSVTIMDRSGLNGDLRYNMSPTSGILKKFNLKSSIDFSVTFSTTTDQQRRSIENKEMATVQKNTGWMVSPKADYRFSEKFTGSAMVRVENTKDMTNKVHKVREVSISGRMVF